MLYMEHSALTEKFGLTTSYVVWVEHERIRPLCLPLVCFDGTSVVVFYLCGFWVSKISFLIIFCELF